MQSTQTFKTSAVRSTSARKCLVSVLSASQTFPVLCLLADVAGVRVSPCCEQSLAQIPTAGGQKFSEVYLTWLKER